MSKVQNYAKNVKKNVMFPHIKLKKMGKIGKILKKYHPPLSLVTFVSAYRYVNQCNMLHLAYSSLLLINPICDKSTFSIHTTHNTQHTTYTCHPSQTFLIKFALDWCAR